ncbi:EAL domain-containing protein [Nitriliruptoraceae bacterium ZYF776]|nr:EAL domain-containing protein [Profundirhabdus halotolerans]
MVLAARWQRERPPARRDVGPRSCPRAAACRAARTARCGAQGRRGAHGARCGGSPAGRGRSADVLTGQPTEEGPVSLLSPAEPGARRPPPDPGAIDAVLDRRAVHAVFQPIVELTTGRTVGYEALARGPQGGPLAAPAALFAAATAAGRLAELDWVCRAAALRAAARELHPATALFLNAEPAALGAPCPADLEAEVAASSQGRRVVIELTERALTADPHAVLSAVRDARRFGWTVALDDVGADPASLAMLPFVRPEVIKLDMALIQGRTTGYVARVVTAVLAHAERTGATVLAEGVEDDAHLELARSIGASLGQGWAFGRPGPLPSEASSPAPTLPVLPRPTETDHGSAFALAASVRTPRLATKRTPLAFSHQLEQRALDVTDEPVLLSCFQSAERFTEATVSRYARLADRCALVVALGRGVALEPAPGVRGGPLAADDPLVDEWTVVVVTPHFAAALIARDLGDDGPELDRRFEHVITHDRDLVERAATILLARVPRSI